MSCRMFLISVVSVLSVVLSPLWASSVIYVDDDAPLGGDGQSWATAYRFLQDGLCCDAAKTGDVEIRVAQGIYTPDCDEANPDGTGDRKASFELQSGMTLKGGFAGLLGDDPNAWDVELYETVLSGDLAENDVLLGDPCLFRDQVSREDNSLNVVTAGVLTVLHGVTVTGGHAQPYKCTGRNNCPDVLPTPGFNGGGMLIETDFVTVRQCQFHDNFAEQGGGGMFVYQVEGVLLEDWCI